LEVPISARGHIPFYVDVEYLRWWIQRPSLPPLLTVGSIDDFQFGQAGPGPGALGAPNTRILLGQFSQDYAHNGIRTTAGFWLDPSQILGVQGSFFYLNTIQPQLKVSGDGSNPTMVIARPFIEATTGLESADPVVVPGSLAGTIIFSNPQ